MLLWEEDEELEEPGISAPAGTAFMALALCVHEGEKAGEALMLLEPAAAAPGAPSRMGSWLDPRGSAAFVGPLA